MKKLINKKINQVSQFFEGLIYNEASSMETFMVAVFIFVFAFGLLWIINPSILHLR